MIRELRRFECTVEGANKYWAIWTADSSSGVSNIFQVVTNWGKIGTPGQQYNKKFYAEYAQNKYYEKIIRDKVGKGGYVEMKPAQTQGTTTWIPVTPSNQEPKKFRRKIVI